MLNDTVPVTAITTHANEVRATSDKIVTNSKTIDDNATAITNAVSTLRNSKPTDQQKSALDTIQESVDQIKASNSTVTDTAKGFNASAANLVKLIPNTDEHPFVSPGQTGTGTAVHPKSDDVRPDPRNDQRR